MESAVAWDRTEMLFTCSAVMPYTVHMSIK